MYLALYRKYRPTVFEDVLSQPHITSVLQNEVASNHTAHAYLFTGPRGTGKTTCSKILAMAVNCENPQNGNPCHKCGSCLAIEEGSTLDVVEIDAASNNGVDNIRQLRDEAAYTPAQCKYRVYIIDETHMLSTGAFNALLKIMEEPPEHVKFILATTEAHKVPATILSRCQRFDFRRVLPEDIKKNVLEISSKEDFTVTDDAADLIARLADGGMRDALSILDQCVAFSREITVETVAAAAGVAGREYLFSLTDCLCESNPSNAIEIIDELYAMSKDLQGLLSEFINHLRNIMLMLTIKEPKKLIVALPNELVRLKEYTTRLPLSSLLYAIDEMQECLDKMSRSSDKRLTLELCMIKLCTPRLNESTDGIRARLERLENMIKNGVPAQSAPEPIKTESSVPKETKPEPAKTPKQTKTPEPAKTPQAMHAAPETLSEQGAKTPMQPRAPLSENGEFAPFAEWQEVLSELSSVSMPLCSLLTDSQAFARGGILYIDVKNAMASTLMKQEGNAVKLLEIIERKTGLRYKLRMKSAPKLQETSNDPLQQLLEKAKASGIEVSEE